MRPAHLGVCVSLALRVVLWCALFLAVFGLMAWSTAYLLAWLRDEPVLERRNLHVGAVCGLVAWLFLAVVHLRRETLALSFAHRETFVHRVKTVFGEMGYQVMTESPTALRLKPSFTAFLMGGAVHVRLDHDSALIAGPRLSLERLRKRLRLYQQIAHACDDSRRRHTEPLLKRVHLSLRLPPDRWAEVIDHLIGALGTDAALVCDLHILAQSAGGLPESTVEKERDWLHDRGIDVEIRKDHVQLR